MAEIHRLKTINPYFNDLWLGKKNFEIRKNDRGFHEGDKLILEEYNPNSDGKVTGGPYEYTGRVIHAKVSYVLENCPQYGLQEGYCILGLTI